MEAKCPPTGSPPVLLMPSVISIKKHIIFV